MFGKIRSEITGTRGIKGTLYMIWIRAIDINSAIMEFRGLANMAQNLDEEKKKRI